VPLPPKAPVDCGSEAARRAAAERAHKQVTSQLQGLGRRVLQSLADHAIRACGDAELAEKWISLRDQWGETPALAAAMLAAMKAGDGVTQPAVAGVE
jgi:hypothetical protein